MTSSDVRSIESLQRTRSGLLLLSGNWNSTLEEIRVAIHRANDYFGSQVPAYWRRQTELAERELTEAKDNLQQKQSAARAEDRPSALEARKRVERAKRRMDLCYEKTRFAKTLAIEIRQQCDEMLGPLADMTEHCDNYLPAAGEHLKRLIDTLLQYADSSGLTPVDDAPATPPAPEPPDASETEL